MRRREFSVEGRRGQWGSGEVDSPQTYFLSWCHSCTHPFLATPEERLLLSAYLRIKPAGGTGSLGVALAEANQRKSKGGNKGVGPN